MSTIWLLDRYVNYVLQYWLDVPTMIIDEIEYLQDDCYMQSIDYQLYQLMIQSMFHQYHLDNRQLVPINIMHFHNWNNHCIPTNIYTRAQFWIEKPNKSGIRYPIFSKKSNPNLYLWLSFVFDDDDITCSRNWILSLPSR
jgi:hypothetical protein